MYLYILCILSVIVRGTSNQTQDWLILDASDFSAVDIGDTQPTQVTSKPKGDSSNDDSDIEVIHVFDNSRSDEEYMAPKIPRGKIVPQETVANFSFSIKESPAPLTNVQPETISDLPVSLVDTTSSIDLEKSTPLVTMKSPVATESMTLSTTPAFSTDVAQPTFAATSILPPGWLEFSFKKVRYLDSFPSLSLEDIRKKTCDCYMRIIKKSLKSEYDEILRENPILNDSSLEQRFLYAINSALEGLIKEDANLGEIIMFLSLILFQNPGPKALLRNISFGYDTEISKTKTVLNYGITQLKRSQNLSDWLRDEGSILKKMAYVELCRYLDCCNEHTISLEVKYYKDVILPKVYLNGESTNFFIYLLYLYSPEPFTKYDGFTIMNKKAYHLEKEMADFINSLDVSLQLYKELCAAFLENSEPIKKEG